MDESHLNMTQSTNHIKKIITTKTRHVCYSSLNLLLIYTAIILHSNMQAIMLFIDVRIIKKEQPGNDRLIIVD